MTNYWNNGLLNKELYLAQWKLLRSRGYIFHQSMKNGDILSSQSEDIVISKQQESDDDEEDLPDLEK